MEMEHFVLEDLFRVWKRIWGHGDRPGGEWRLRWWRAPAEDPEGGGRSSLTRRSPD